MRGSVNTRTNCSPLVNASTKLVLARLGGKRFNPAGLSCSSFIQYCQKVESVKGLPTELMKRDGEELRVDEEVTGRGWVLGRAPERE